MLRRRAAGRRVSQQRGRQAFHRARPPDRAGSPESRCGRCGRRDRAGGARQRTLQARRLRQRRSSRLHGGGLAMRHVPIRRIGRMEGSFKKPWPPPEVQVISLTQPQMTMLKSRTRGVRQAFSRQYRQPGQDRRAPYRERVCATGCPHLLQIPASPSRRGAQMPPARCAPWPVAPAIRRNTPAPSRGRPASHRFARSGIE